MGSVVPLVADRERLREKRSQVLGRTPSDLEKPRHELSTILRDRLEVGSHPNGLGSWLRTWGNRGCHETRG